MNMDRASFMVLTLCAYTMVQTDTEVPFSLFEHTRTVRVGDTLLEESCRFQNGHNYQHTPTRQKNPHMVVRHANYLELGKSNAAW